MTREEFEKWLDNNGIPFGFGSNPTRIYQESDVRALFSLLVPAWIPVSERLPENNDVYLCMTIDDWDILVPSVISFFSGKFQSNELSEIGGKVTHWMPLPPLPAEEV